MVRLSFSHLKACVFCVGLCLTIWRGYDCTAKYLQFNRSTTVDMVNSKDTLAPALILCPEFYSAYNQIKLNELGIANAEEYKNGTWKGNSSMDEKIVYNSVTYGLEDLIEKLEIQLISGSTKLFMETNFSSLNTFEIFTKSLGRCFEIDFGQFDASPNNVQITTK